MALFSKKEGHRVHIVFFSTFDLWVGKLKKRHCPGGCFGMSRGHAEAADRPRSSGGQAKQTCRCRHAVYSNVDGEKCAVNRLYYTRYCVLYMLWMCIDLTCFRCLGFILWMKWHLWNGLLVLLCVALKQLLSLSIFKVAVHTLQLDRNGHMKQAYLQGYRFFWPWFKDHSVNNIQQSTKVNQIVTAINQQNQKQNVQSANQQNQQNMDFPLLRDTNALIAY